MRPGSDPGPTVHFLETPKTLKNTIFQISSISQNRTGTVVKPHFSPWGRPGRPRAQQNAFRRNVAFTRDAQVLRYRIADARIEALLATLYQLYCTEE